MPRRLIIATALAATCALAACDERDGAGDHRVLILGIDGMDPVLLTELMASGRMPTFARFARDGFFTELETSAPPQSPVAWSNVIAGADPGTHQIYDFVHRDPRPEGDLLGVLPYLSTSRVDPPSRDWSIDVGDWTLPLFGATPVSLRRGPTFWDPLVAAGVPTTVYRMPANYPPPTLESSGPFRCLCGMGTPDLHGTYGLFTHFTSDPAGDAREVSGGRFARLEMDGERGTGALIGPPNFLRKVGDDESPPALEATFDVVRDAERDVVRLDFDGEPVVLQANEWSDWIPVRLETGVPGATVLGAAGLPTGLDAMVRVYVQQVHPTIELYVSPLNLDPQRPANAIAAPGDFAADLAEANGRYYTTGIPEDTKALRAGALNEDEFLAQVGVLRGERMRQYAHALEHFDDGVLFFYFGHIDQLSHIFWRDRDPDHPARDPDEAARYGTVIEDAYIEMDRVLADALDRLDDDDTVIVMSDHGFSSFRRGFSLNAWLRDEGYLAVPGERIPRFLLGVDWSRTRAYGLGLNALYLNERGREKKGIVSAAERQALLDEIAEKLLRVRDDDGTPVVRTVYDVRSYYPGADPAVAPDLLIGYDANYRASWSTAEGGVSRSVLSNNRDRWSGDHCIAHTVVPGILLANRPLVVDDPALTDLAPTILAEYDLAAPPSMTGRPLFEPRHEE